LNPAGLLAHGERVADLAERYCALARARGLRMLVLKGVAVSGELSEGFHERPVADADVWCLDRGAGWRGALDLATSMGLVEFGRTDHGTAFRETETRAVIEVHRTLVSAAEAFTIPVEDIWAARAPVRGRGFERLSNLDWILHAALHAAFQHGLSIRGFHLTEFRRAFEVFRPNGEALLDRARQWGAARALGLVAAASCLDAEETRSFLEGPGQARLRTRALRWTHTDWERAPSLARLARVRWECVEPRHRPRWLLATFFPSVPGGFWVQAARLLRLARRFGAGS
jgi:hypothetical protein